VGDKLVEAGSDPQTPQDVYQVDLTFAMVVEPSTENGDDLIVKLLDAQGNVIRQARLAGDGSGDGADMSELVKNEDRSYTFKDIPMAENSDLTFDLRLEGAQYLKKGVYVYSSPNTGADDTFQTLVGIAEGAQQIGVSAALTFSFSVDEEARYHAQTYWSLEKEPTPTPTPNPTPEPEPDPVPTPEPPAPPVETPAIRPPRSGDGSQTLWGALLLLGGCMMAAVMGRRKNRV